jgi:hypothetical protein
MTKRLKIDRYFRPCPVEEGDELFTNGIFEFNVTRMVAYVKHSPQTIPLEEAAIKDISPGFSHIDECHLDAVDISRPVILAEISPGRYNLIDGHHRVEKARRIGLERIAAYRLSVEEHIQFLTDRKAYEIFVGYWNGKVKEIG